MSLKKILILHLSLILLIFTSCSNQEHNKTVKSKNVKNVIIMIPDGCSIELLQLARLYKSYPELADKTELSFDSLICGLVKASTGTTVIGESAANATAILTGKKSIPGFLGVDTAGNDVISVFNLARKQKKKVIGIVGTVSLAHATLSASMVNVKNRGDYNNILKQLVYNGPEVLFAAGGKGYLNHDFNKKGKQNTFRSDKLNLEQILTNEKRTSLYFYKKDFDKIDTSKYNKVWWLYNGEQDYFPNDFDRPDTVPSLAEMTAKAISILKHNNNGFVMLVEGSKIDWEAHANEAIGTLSEFLAFEEAVEVAINFAAKDKNTAVIIVPDHGTGGITIGNKNSNGESKTKYSKLNAKDFGYPLFINKGKTPTGEGFQKILKAKCDSIASANKTESIKKCPENAYVFLKDFISKTYSIPITQKDADTIINATYLSDFDFIDVFGPIYSNYTYIGWTTNGHTGEDLFLAIYHPSGYVRKGVVDITEITYYVKDILNLK